MRAAGTASLSTWVLFFFLALPRPMGALPPFLDPPDAAEAMRRTLFEKLHKIDEPPAPEEIPLIDVGLMTRQTRVKATSATSFKVKVGDLEIEVAAGEVWSALLVGAPSKKGAAASSTAGKIALVDPSGKVRGTSSEVVWIPQATTPAAATPPTVKVFQVEHDVGLPQHGREDREYPGTIRVVIDKAGKLAAVNRVDLESYLEGVVPSEMPSSYPDGALEAQAVAARSMTKVILERGGNGEPYDICSDQYCQVYTGRTRWDERTARAVRATSGYVLKNGEATVPTYFSANCGGHGESVEHVWGGAPHPSLKGRPDAPAGQSTFPVPFTEAGLAAWLESAAAMDHCGNSAGVTNPHHRWVVQLGSKGLDGLVNKKHKVGTVTKLTPIQRGASGRLIALEVTGSKKTVVVRKELEIRRLLGGLKSSLFVVKVTRNRSGQPTAWELRGAGFGHGAGMCQNGARGMALIGRPFPEILAQYYPDSQLVRLY